MAMDLTSLLQGNVNPTEGGGVSPVTVSAPPVGGQSTDFQKSVYNNLPEIQAAQQGQAQNPQHTGLFGVKGTLRNVLGILGDAMLMQHGNQAVYAPRVQQEREADAMAGFQSDPRAAAGRLAALPGGAELANKILDTAATQDLHRDSLNSQNYYRQTREEAIQDARDARLRQGIGGILSSAAQPGPDGKIDPQKWTQARNLALKMGGKIKDFDEDEIPETADQYNAGYGMSAAQVARTQTSQDSIGERYDASQLAHQDRRYAADNRNAPQPTATSLVDRLISKQNSGQPLSPAEQQYWDTNVANKGKTKKPLNMPPGLIAPSTGGGPTPQFKNGVTYKDAHGNSAKYNNGQWIPVNP